MTITHTYSTRILKKYSIPKIH